MRFGSICSGIEAASVAGAPLGWEPAWLSEVDVPASAVLAHRHGASAPQFPPDFEDDPPAKTGARTAAQKHDAWTRTAAQKHAAWQRAVARVQWGSRIVNWGDMTRLPDLIRSGVAEAPEALVGGTPCQSFSVAGLRAGLADARGNLTLTYVEILDAIDAVRADRGEPACVALWENVPGVFTHKDNPFGCFLAALAGEDLPLEPPGERWTNAGLVLGPKRAVAWRVGNAEYFGLAQRRQRVYLVASARDGFDPGTVLLEFEGVRRDSPPSREDGPEVAAAAGVGADARGGSAGAGDRPGADGLGGDRGVAVAVVCMAHGQGNAEVLADGGAPTLTCNHEAPIIVHGTQDPIVQQDCAMPLGCNSGQENVVLAFSCKDYGADVAEGVAPTLRAMGHAGSHANAGGQVAVLTVALRGRDGGATAELGDEVATCLRASGGGGDKPYALTPIAFDTTQITHPRNGSNPQPDGPCHTLPAAGHAPTVAFCDVVRRLMPIECERLQGFPDHYTADLPGGAEAADGPRYKQIGNSWAVPHARWVMARIDAALAARTQPTLPDLDPILLWFLAA